MSGKCTVYKPDGIGTIIAPCAAAGYYHIYAIQDRTAECFINRRPLAIGYMTFIAGKQYKRFGSNRKTSAGFIWYDGAPITFVGTHRDNALFAAGDGPFVYQEFQQCYFSWQFCQDLDVFIALNHMSAARIMEMDVPPSGPSQFKLGDD